MTKWSPETEEAIRRRREYEEQIAFAEAIKNRRDEPTPAEWAEVQAIAEVFRRKRQVDRAMAEHSQ